MPFKFLVSVIIRWLLRASLFLIPSLGFCSGIYNPGSGTGGGGGSSSLAVTIGVSRSSPTSDLLFNPNQFSGSISGSSITVNLLSSQTFSGAITLPSIQNQSVLFTSGSVITGSSSTWGVDTTNTQSSAGNTLIDYSNTVQTQYGLQTPLAGTVISITTNTGVANGVIRELSGNSGGFIINKMGRTATDFIYGVVGGNNNFFTPTNPGDVVVDAAGATAAVQIGAGSTGGTPATVKVNISSVTINGIETITGNLAATTFTSSATFVNANGLSTTYNVNAGSMTGAGLTSCSAANSAVTWNNSTNLFGCNTISSSGGGGSSSFVTFNGTTNSPGVAVDSPTYGLNAEKAQFILTSQGGATTYMTLNSSSATLQGNSITFIALAISTGAIQSSLSSVILSTGQLQNQVNSIASSTGTLFVDVSQIAVATTTLGLNFPVSLSTGTTGSLAASNIAAGALGSGVIASSLTATGVGAASYTNANITVNLEGQITAASNGSAGSGTLTPGSTMYINNTDLTVGSTAFYVSSGVVQGPFSVISQTAGSNASTDTLTMNMSNSSFVNSTLAFTRYAPGGLVITSAGPFGGGIGATLQLNNSGQTTSPCTDTGGVIANGWCMTGSSITVAVGLGKTGFTIPSSVTGNPIWRFPQWDNQGFWTSDGASNLSFSPTISFSPTFTSSVSVTGGNGLAVNYNINVGSMTGANLTNCGDGTHALSWSSSSNQFGCQALTTGSGGGGSFNLVVATGNATGFNNPPTSSTTASGYVILDSATFLTKAIAGTTVFVSLNTSSVTLAGNNLAGTYLTNSSATATYLQQTNAASTYLAGSSATITYMNVNQGVSKSSITATYLQITNAANTYLTGNQNITLSGDSQGTGATAITVKNAGQQPNITTFTSSITVTNALNVQESQQANIMSLSTSASASALVTVSSTPASSPYDYLLNVSSITALPVFGIQNNSHIVSSGTTPSLSSCGTNPAISGTDSAGTVTGGSASTGCTVTFAAPYVHAPNCAVMPQTGSITAVFSYTISTTAITVTETGLGTGLFNYVCIAKPGG